MSPRSFMPSGSSREEPPTMSSSSAILTSSWPKISGAKLPASRLSRPSLCSKACQHNQTENMGR